MTKEEKAPTHNEVTQHGDAVRAAITGAVSADGTFEALGSLSFLLSAALLGVQVPGLKRLSYIGEHHHPDLTWKARCEEEKTRADALQARVAELTLDLEHERSNSYQLSVSGLDTENQRIAIESERDALRAKMTEVPTLVRKALHRHGLSVSLCNESAEIVRAALSTTSHETTPSLVHGGESVAEAHRRLDLMGVPRFGRCPATNRREVLSLEERLELAKVEATETERPDSVVCGKCLMPVHEGKDSQHPWCRNPPGEEKKLDPWDSPHLTQTQCHANREGDCEWKMCPQNRDGEPKRSGRHCPFDTDPHPDDE